MPNERTHATSYVLTIAMIIPAITACELFTVDMCMILNLTFCDFTFDGNDNVGRIFYCL